MRVIPRSANINSEVEVARSSDDIVAIRINRCNDMYVCACAPMSNFRNLFNRHEKLKFECVKCRLNATITTNCSSEN